MFVDENMNETGCIFLSVVAQDEYFDGRTLEGNNNVIVSTA